MKHYFTKTEIALWSVSAAAIILSFIMFDGKSFLTLASLSDPGYISVVVCFAAFLANDIYGSISWKRLEKKQKLMLEKYRRLW